MKLKLKICGMRDPANILQVADLKPDYMGFIFYQKSKRFVGDDFTVPANFSKEIKRVGVFVNEDKQEIQRQVKKNKLDYVQLHGDESPEVCGELRESKIGVIKVFPVDQSFDFDKTKPFQRYADFFLFDTRSDRYGGTGKTFDWNLLNQYDQHIPFFLSGGVSIENVRNIKALDSMNLHAVDVNSGAESSPGLKEIEKVKAIAEVINS